MNRITHIMVPTDFSGPSEKALEFALDVATRYHAAVPKHQIPREALTAKIDLIVIGTHGRTGLEHLLLGSVAELIVRIAPCPVLAVRDSGSPAPASA